MKNNFSGATGSSTSPARWPCRPSFPPPTPPTPLPTDPLSRTSTTAPSVPTPTGPPPSHAPATSSSPWWWPTSWARRRPPATSTPNPWGSRKGTWPRSGRWRGITTALEGGRERKNFWILKLSGNFWFSVCFAFEWCSDE